MTMKLSIETFISVVRKSGLSDEDRLQQALKKFSPQDKNRETAADLAQWLISENVLTKWQAEKLLQGKHRGYFLGKYKLLSLLGKGGMSSVYLAEHLLMRRQCALKVLPAKRVDDSSYLERFHREAQAAASLDHPNIVRAYDVDYQDEGERQIHFLVMEYVEGSSLQELVPPKGLPSILDAVEYARQAAAGLQHAHENGMVHRDIKPGNVLVDTNGVVKILDLGLARFFKVDEGNEALTIRHDEKVLGTADYLAPEQALDSHSVDARADLYSLGCTLYFMVTGQPPFTEGTLAQRLLAHQVKTPAAVESIRTDLPPSLASIIKKMMEKKPEDRFQTAAELETVLFNWVDQNTDMEWRKAHFSVYGTRTSDSEIAPIPKLRESKKPNEPKKTGDINNPAQKKPGPAVATKGVRTSTSPLPTSNATQTDPPGSDVTNDTSLNLFLATLTQPAFESITPKPPTAPFPNLPPLTPPEPLPPTPKPPIVETTPITDVSIPQVQLPIDPSDSPAAKAGLKRSSSNVKPIKESSRQPSRRWADWVSTRFRGKEIAKFTAALIASGIVLYSLSGFIFAKRHERDTTTSVPFSVDKNEVTVGGKSGEYKSIREALIAVRNQYRPGTGTKTLTIKIAEGVYTDRIQINGYPQPWPEGIKLLGVGTVQLAPKGDEPVIRLANVTRFIIENVQIDAANKATALELADDLYECSLKDIVVSGFTDTGILCRGTQGLSFSNSQFMLDRIRFEAANKRAVGIRLQNGSDHDVNNLIIRECRFLRPMSGGIVTHGPAPYGIEISRCIFNETTDGIRFEGDPQLKQIRVINNSFRKTKVGIHFSKMPNERSAELTFRRNLFLETAYAEATIEPNFDASQFRSMISSAPPGIEENWSDRPKPPTPRPDEVSILFENHGHQGEPVSFVSSDPANPKFLTPDEKSPIRDVGTPQGLDLKWVGAMSP